MFLITVLILAVFFAVNMGSASFAASFAAPYGGKILTRKKAAALFLFFVILGAIVYGEKVSVTLGKDIMSGSSIDNRALFVIFLSGGFSMYIANVMKIPQSTSLVTVAAIAGVGAYLGTLHLETILFFIPFWIIFPIASFLITKISAGYLYPPRKHNFWIYERFINQQDKLKVFVIVTSCYNAFSVGTNNVPNVAGPLMQHEGFSLLGLLAAFAMIYGAGAFIFTGPLKTAGSNIVPLGLMTASIISLVSGSLMLFASFLGIPQSFVMLQMGAIFAIATLKHGPEVTFDNPLTRKTFYTWTINPIITFGVSYLISKIVIN